MMVIVNMSVKCDIRPAIKLMSRRHGSLTQYQTVPVTGVYFTPHCAVQTLGENYSLHFRGSSGLNNTAEWDLPGHTVDLTFLFSLRSSTLLTVLRGARRLENVKHRNICAPLLSPVSSLVSLLWCL